MSTHDNAPPPPDWKCDPRPDPFVNADPKLTIPATIYLGEN